MKSRLYSCISHKNVDSCLQRMGCVPTWLTVAISVLALVEGRFESLPQNFEVMEGENVVLPCKYNMNQNDSLDVKWLFDGPFLTSPIAVSSKTLVSRPGTYIRGDHSRGEYNLHLDHVTERDDGSYRCQVHIGHRPPDLTHRLSVKVPVHGVTTSRKGIIRVLRHSTVSLRCSAIGKPNPVITWDRKISSFPPDSLVNQTGQVAVITMPNFTEQYGGTYTCSARNEHSHASAEPVFLEVIFKPLMSQFLLNYTVTFGGNVNLTCNYSGNPKPTVTWYANDSQTYIDYISHVNHSTFSYSSILTLHNVIEDSVYTCLTSNSLGTARKSINIFVKKNSITRNVPVTLSSTAVMFTETPLLTTQTEQTTYVEQTTQIEHTSHVPVILNSRTESHILKAPTNSPSRTGFLAAIVIPVIVLLLLFVDTICCFRFDWGLLSCTFGRLFKIKRPLSARVHSVQCKPAVGNGEAENTREEETQVIPLEEARAMDEEEERLGTPSKS